MPSLAALDRYGYALPHLTKEEATARNATITSEAMRARNWTSVPFSALAPKKLKQLVRDGIPANLRLRLWLELSGGQSLKQQHAPNYFTNLGARTSPSTYVMDVEAAILHSMPGHQFLLLPFGLQSVAKVVQAFHSHTGRSLQHNTTCIAAFLVSVVGLGREEDCFWTMTALLESRLPASCTQESSGKGTVEHCVLNELLRRCSPKLLSTFAAMDYNLTDLTATWFSHLFCGTLPAETAVRVWDCVFCEGPKVLFRVALALLKRQEGIVLGNPQMIRTIQWRISRAYNADDLLKTAFKGIGSLSMAVITRARQDVENSMLQQHKVQAKRLEALLCPARLSPQPSASSADSELASINETPEKDTEHSDDDGVAAFQMRLAPIRVN